MSSKFNVVGGVSHFFAVRKPFSLMLLLGLVLFGLLAFFFMSKQYNPEIIRPAFLLELQYEGATVDEAINRVAYELVEKINSVPGVDEVKTEVKDGAKISTTVIFDVGYNKTTAKIDLLSYINQHSYLAKGTISPPAIFEINPETIPIMQVVFTSAILPIEDLRQEVTKLSYQISDVANVSEVSVVGGYPLSLVVEVDQVRLQQNKIIVADIVAVLKSSQSRVVSLGLVSDKYTLETTFDGRLNTVDEIGQTEIKDGINLRDVAKVYLGTAGVRSYLLEQNKGTDSKEVVMLSVAKVEGSSAPIVSKEVINIIDEYTKKLPAGTLYTNIVGDDGATASGEILGLTSNLIQSIIIVALVLLLFLSLRSALVVLVAIPTTLLIVFGIGYLFDQTINRITLFALILSLGLLVDSAIVVVENIYSHLKEAQNQPTGRSREQVIAKAVDEIGVGLLLSTITSVVVFIPMFFITGMMGPYMGPIAFFVPLALIVSLLVAIVFVPFVSTLLIDTNEKTTWLSKKVETIITGLLNLYRRTMRAIFASRKKQRTLLLSVLGLFLVTLILPITGLVHFQMLPHADRDQFYVYVDLPFDTSVEATKEVSQKISEILLNDEKIKSVQQFVGTPPIVDFSNMFKGAQGRSLGSQATLRVNLVETKKRAISSTNIVYALRADIVNKYPEYETMVRLMEEPPGPPVQATLVSKVMVEDDALRAEIASALFSEYQKLVGVVDIKKSSEVNIGKIFYDFDSVAGDYYGVRPEAVALTLKLLSGTIEIAEYQSSANVEYTPILLSTAATERMNSEMVLNNTVLSKTGEPVPLRSVLKTRYEERPSDVSLEDTRRVTYVTAEIENRSVVYVMIELMHQVIKGGLSDYQVSDWNLFGMELVNNDGVTVQIDFGGEWEMTLENFRDLGLAMLVSLLLVYGVLVGQYNNFATPGYVLLTVPLGLIGIIWGFFILDTVFGIYLTATALIGFIALIGIAVNNAIILLEYVDQMRARGHALAEAMLEAGTARLRPILLTSLTTVLGSLTIASDPVWSGLAWAIVFGLSLSTILTLVIYPTVLVYFTNEKINK